MTHDITYQNALELLRGRISEPLFALLEEHSECEELHLRADMPVSLTVDGENILPGMKLTERELRDTLFGLCDQSVHAHEETICRGYMMIGGAIRVAVSGQAVVHNGIVTAIGQVYCLSIRMPHTLPRVNDPLTEKLAVTRFMEGILIFAPPGVGKTTQLRISAAAVSSAPYLRRTVLLDTRGELYEGTLMRDSLIDRLESYPRGAGLEIAVRTLAPQLIFCDEIGDEAEARTILAMQNTGVPLVASAHAVSYAELLRRPQIRMLLEAHVFAHCGRLMREGRQFQIEWRDNTVYGTEKLIC